MKPRCAPWRAAEHPPSRSTVVMALAFDERPAHARGSSLVRRPRRCTRAPCDRGSPAPRRCSAATSSIAGLASAAMRSLTPARATRFQNRPVPHGMSPNHPTSAGYGLSGPGIGQGRPGASAIVSKTASSLSAAISPLTMGSRPFMPDIDGMAACRPPQRLKQHLIEAKIAAGAKQFDTDDHGFVTVSRLIAVGAKQSVPPGQIEAEVAVRAPALCRGEQRILGRASDHRLRRLRGGGHRHPAPDRKQRYGPGRASGSIAVVQRQRYRSMSLWTVLLLSLLPGLGNFAGGMLAEFGKTSGRLLN